ncbi:TPA: hypothetical protein I8287_002554 [Kluyvera intermedia]|nr:hypothetical protein [Kluyvera intermedia]
MESISQSISRMRLRLIRATNRTSCSPGQRQRHRGIPGQRQRHRGIPGQRQRHRGIPGCGCALSGPPIAPAVAPVSVSATGDYPGCGCALSGPPTAPVVAPVSVSATGGFPDAAAPYPGYQPHQP